jgi:hypothetical protein
MAGSNIAGGAWTKLVANKYNPVTEKYDGDDLELAYATGADYDEDFAVAGLETLGHLGPSEYNSHGYSCTINVSMLIAKNKAIFNQVVPNRADVQLDGHLPQWQLTFRSTTADGKIYAQFKGAVVASNGQQIQANQFISSNMRMMAIERVKDPDETGGAGGGGGDAE